MKIHFSALKWSLYEPLEVAPPGFLCFVSVSEFPLQSLSVLLHVLAMNKKKGISVTLDVQIIIVMVKPVNLKKKN